MKKIALLTAVPLVLSSAIAATSAQAAVAVDDEGKVKLYGDLRLRAEYDNREYTSDDGRADLNRDRLRYRARLGVKWQAMDDLTADIRLVTGTLDPQSPHKNLDMLDGDNKTSGGDFGVDRAYVAYTGLKNTKIVGGKAAPLYWQQTELFFDGDVNLEGIQASHKCSDVTLNAGYSVVNEAGITGEDAKLLTAQAVYAMDAFKVAAGYAGYRKDKGDAFDPTAVFGAREFYQIVGQYKTGDWLFGADYQSAAATEDNDTAYVLQGRYNVNESHSVRLYYWYVEANSVHLTQDDFRSSSNFQGPEIQYKHQFASAASYRVRLFVQDQIEDDASKIGSDLNTMGADVDNELRLRFDLDVKF